MQMTGMFTIHNFVSVSVLQIFLVDTYPTVPSLNGYRSAWVYPSVPVGVDRMSEGDATD
jgi:hypothetical protein